MGKEEVHLDRLLVDERDANLAKVGEEFERWRATLGPRPPIGVGAVAVGSAPSVLGRLEDELLDRSEGNNVRMQQQRTCSRSSRVSSAVEAQLWKLSC